MRYIILLVTIFTLSFIMNSNGASELSTAKLLPVHEGKDAYTPNTAFGGGLFMVVWQSGRLNAGDLRLEQNYHSSIVACRVDTFGNTIDATPIVISDSTDLREFPRVAFGGGQFLIVWQDLRNGEDWDIYASRMTLDGTVLDPDGILISGGTHNQAMPRVDWDGTNFNVVWQDARSGSTYEVFLARVSPEGTLLEAEGVKIATGNVNCVAPDVAHDGSGKVLVFSVSAGGRFAGYVFNKVPTTGTFVTDGVPEMPHVYTLNSGVYPYANTFPVALAHGSGGYLLAWKNEVPFGRGNCMEKNNMALFNDSGARITDLHIGYASFDIKRIVDPDVVWDGSGYLAVWHEQATLKNDTTHDKVCMARIASTGELLTSEMLIAGRPMATASGACVTSNGSGKSLIAYEQHPDTGSIPITIGYRLSGEGMSISAEPVLDKMVFDVYPNPFNPVVNISVNGIDAQISIYDITGKLIETLCFNNRRVRRSAYPTSSNATTIQWNASAHPSGIYFVRLKSGSNVINKRLLLVR